MFSLRTFCIRYFIFKSFSFYFLSDTFHFKKIIFSPLFMYTQSSPSPHKIFPYFLYLYYLFLPSFLNYSFGWWTVLSLTPLTRISILIVGYWNLDFGKQMVAKSFSALHPIFFIYPEIFLSPSRTNQFSILVHNYFKILILLDLSIWNLYCMIFVNMPQFKPLFKIVGNVSLFYNRNFTKCELYIPGVKDFFQIWKFVDFYLCECVFFTSKKKNWGMH